VDIRTVRLVANLIEKDARRVSAGTPAVVEVDAFPGESFRGSVSRVAPVFDPATRTAEMEIEVPNPGFRLKPGMYARVNLTVGTRTDALTIPRNAIVDLEGKTGVFIAQAAAAPPDGSAPTSGRSGDGAGSAPAMTARFLPVQTGIRSGERVEVLGGLDEGTRIITMGAGALRDGDRVILAVADRGGRRGGGGQGQGQGSEQRREQRPEGAR
jgi:multidrug efflux pump subunit AcrA (membrane-fusion protein)